MRGPGLHRARAGGSTRLWRPGTEFDPVAVARVVWLAATVSTPLLLIAFPPTAVHPTVGWAVGWTWAAFHLVVLLVIARQAGTSLRVLYAATLVDVGMLAVMQWLAGGWSTPYHLFIFVGLYAMALSQPPRLTLAATPLVLAATFAPLAYGGTDARATDVAVAAGLWGLLSWVGTDVTTVIARQRRDLRRAAEHDALTGLDNRRAFTEHVDARLASIVDDGHVALIGIGDVDLFKAVNDRHGHRAGDECLRSAARRILETCRREDPATTAFRWGGDEFVVVLAAPSADAVADVRSRVDDGLTLVETPVDGVPGVGLTFGWSVWDGRSTAEQAVEQADRQLVARKDARPRRAGRPTPTTHVRAGWPDPATVPPSTPHQRHARPAPSTSPDGQVDR